MNHDAFQQMLLSVSGVSGTSSTIDAVYDLGSESPLIRIDLTNRYVRDSKVRKAVLDRAKGKCEYCGEVGFTKSDKSKYLETHHILALANDGADRISNVIALCSNHHREAHFGENYIEIEKKMIEIVDKKNGSRSQN